jgi:AAA family ATP:ADP antiporter
VTAGSTTGSTAAGAAAGAAPDTPAAKGPIETLLTPFADVHQGEAASALMLSLLMFLLLGSYYMLKTAREVFILSEGGAEVKSYASAGQAVLLLVIVPAYSAFASRVSRLQLVTWVSLFFASNILLFTLAAGAHIRIGVWFFLWLGIYNVMVVAQFWGFANDLYTPAQGKRLFPLIGVGSSLGALVGSVRAGQLMEAAGPLRLLVGGVAILVVCVGLARLIDRSARRTAPRQDAVKADEPLGEGQTGFGLLLSNRYLTLIALLVILLNVVNSTGEYLFGRYVVQNASALYGAGAASEAARGRYIGETYSSFFSNINLIGLLLQLFVVSAVFRTIGVGRALFIHPVIAGVGYLVMLLAPSFDAIRWIKTADNAVDYSLGNTTKQVLWLPTSREAKYKAKQAVDAFCVRAGDVLQAAVVYSGELASFTIPAFAALNIVFVLGWLSVVRGLHQKLHARANATGRAEM